MAFYQILYWQDIPSQVKARDDFDEVKVELSSKFIVMIDQKAKELELTSEDDYLAHWGWSEEQECEGTPNEVAELIKKELEAKFISN